ncbi:MAG: AAA family ATPase [Pseudomonadales bacterium]
MSERHREALAHLLYGIKSDGGFILLTGEVGTGKTTICRCLLDQIPADVDIAFILNPKLTAVELLATICDDLKVDYPDNPSIKVLVDRLNQYLLTSYRQGRRTVLIIDEAQNLSTAVLEQLRLLTNLETNERKLLQIILLGQPELLEVLSQRELRQLSQRVTARFHLDALNREEVQNYITHRLEVAGSHRVIFPTSVMRRVFQLSGGIPRVINLICDRALLGAYAQHRDKVNRRIIDHAAREVLGKTPATTYGSAAKVAGVGLVLLAATALTYWQADRIGPLVASVTGGINQAETAAEQLAASVSAQPGQVAVENLATRQKSEGVANDPVLTTVITPDQRPATDSLLRLEGDTASDQALGHLFDLWGIPLQRSNVSPCQQAPTHGVECLTLLGSLRDIRHIDRPAVVKLTIASIEHYFVITGFDGDIVELTSGEGTFRLLPRDLLRSWDGNFAVLWRPPPGPKMLTRGDRGAGVDWLRSQLYKVDGGGSASAGAPFDDDLEQRLRQFQISMGLIPDGIAGTNTFLHLLNTTSGDLPRLTKTASDMRDR